MALCRPAGHAAPHGVLRLCRSGARGGCDARHTVGDRRRHSGGFRRAIPDRAGARADVGTGRAGHVSVQRRRAPAADGARRAERVRPLAGADDRADGDELRLSHRQQLGDIRNRGPCGDGRSEPVSDKGTASPRGAWSATAIAATVAVLVASAVVGFVWLPPQHPSATVAGLWNAICSAAGVVRPPPSKEAIVTPTYPTTRVVVTPQMLAGADARAIGSGATLALRCTMCHGANGQSQAETPNLAGQYRAAIYKQLVDFQTGVRSNAIMQPLVAGLSDTDMRDLADYYAYLPRAPGGVGGMAMAAPTIVPSGAPMRGIAPCG